MATVLHIKPRSPFGNLLREALTEKGVSIKELSRRIATTPEQAEAKRRLLQKYIAGDVSPETKAREEIAAALDVDPARFANNKEHEERTRRLLEAMLPLAEELLELATEAREKAEATR